MLELNLKAKKSASSRAVRLAEMRQWRKHQVLHFESQAKLQQFLDHYKWHKRPKNVGYSPAHGSIMVTWLDYKGA